MHEVFAEWNKGELDSYLIEITRDIFALKRPETGQAAGRPDPRHGRPEGDRQVDRASVALDLGMPLTLIAEAVFARCLSAHEGRARRRPRRSSRARRPPFTGDQEAFVETIRQALYASKIMLATPRATR